MRPEEARDLAEGVLGFRHEGHEELGMALPFEDLQNSVDPGVTELAVGAHGIAEKEIAPA